MRSLFRRLRDHTYLYTIPSFTAITLKLRHLKIAVEEEAGPVFYDSFQFYEEHGSFQEVPLSAEGA